ncbi:MAG: hypothetical protein K2Y23_14905 [Cyanobacteria bacterium]|nr:hypothetical protein [Cyanobacteriota bacterium]
MSNRIRSNSVKAKANMIADAQLALKRTLKTLEAERAKTDNQIRLVRSALAAMGVQNPQLADRTKRSPMTAAERKSVSKRMKAYWAKKRAQ